MTKRLTPWNKIKAEYLQGVTPKELAAKYNLTAKQISDKANEEKWVAEKAKISENIREKVEKLIENATSLAVNNLIDILIKNKARDSDKINASRAILDVSGLKSIKQDITGIDGVSVIINREAVHVESNN
nr:MAG TPA: RNA polymerase sigma-E factor [Caudoviricetes sp.]